MPVRHTIPLGIVIFLVKHNFNDFIASSFYLNTRHTELNKRSGEAAGMLLPSNT